MLHHGRETLDRHGATSIVGTTTITTITTHIRCRAVGDVHMDVAPIIRGRRVGGWKDIHRVKVPGGERSPTSQGVTTPLVGQTRAVVGRDGPRRSPSPQLWTVDEESCGEAGGQMEVGSALCAYGHSRLHLWGSGRHLRLRWPGRMVRQSRSVTWLLPGLRLLPRSLQRRTPWTPPLSPSSWPARSRT